MPYRSYAPEVIAGIIRGARKGLEAAAENYTKAVAAIIDSGYTTGDFSHHPSEVSRRVMYTEPYDTAGGVGITMGTSKTAGFPYELAWELGHQSRYTRRFERVEVWRPLLNEKRDLMVNIIARNIEREAFGGTFNTAFRVAFGGAV